MMLINTHPRFFIFMFLLRGWGWLRKFFKIARSGPAKTPIGARWCHPPKLLKYSNFARWAPPCGFIFIAGWWFQTWLLFSISYMGCHPSHWRTPSCFKMVKLHHQPDILEISRSATGWFLEKRSKDHEYLIPDWFGVAGHSCLHRSGATTSTWWDIRHKNRGLQFKVLFKYIII